MNYFSLFLILAAGLVNHQANAQSMHTKLAVGESVGCFLNSDKILQCWGDTNPYSSNPNYYNRLPTSDVEDFDIDSGSDGDTVCVIQTSGTVTCSGNIARYNATMPTFVAPRKIWIGYRRACVVDSHLGVLCWGDRYQLKWNPLPPMKEKVDHLSSNCAVVDGNVSCWKVKDFGEIQTM